MRPSALITLAVLALLAGAAPALATPAQDVFGVTQAQLDAPALDGDGLVVAIVDSGVDGTHPALTGKVIASQDLVGPEPTPCTDFGHGTWVAGIIAGRETPQLDAGVAPGAQIVSVDVVDSCNQSSLTRIAEGIRWVVDHRAQYGIDVLNLSIGDPMPGGPEIDDAEAAVAEAVQAGLTVVAAAGNKRGLGNVVSPASAEQALTVGAMATQFTPSHLGGPGFAPLLFSSGGPTAAGLLKPDVMGPTDHVAAKPGKPAGEDGSGTSGAAAFVSGLALLMLDADPTLTPAGIKTRIMSTARDWGRPGADEDYGAGRLDAYAALQAAGATLATPPAALAHQTFAGHAAAGSPGVHEVTVTSAGTKLAATLFPDPPDRLPAAPAAELGLRITGPGGVDVTAQTGDRRRLVSVDAPAPGTYTLTVSAAAGANSYALDLSGVLGPAGPAPALTLDTPATRTNDPTPRFEGGATAGVATRVYRNGVQVRSLWALPQGGRWAAEPATPLPDGTYEVGAEQGSTGGTPGRTPRATFTIETTPPDTTLTRTANGFAFSADEPVSRFECSLDGAPFVVCASPLGLATLAPGDHTMAARAVDLAGNVDPTPAIVTWTVPAPPPPDPPASSTTPPVVADTDDPGLSLASSLPRGIGTLRGRGLAIGLRCDEACDLHVELKLTAKLARRLGLPKRLASADADLPGASAATLKLRPSKPTRKRLRGVRSLKAELVIVATDAAGNESRLSQALRLR